MRRAVVVSTNYDDKYLFFLPIIQYAWQKLGWDLICMMPNKPLEDIPETKDLVFSRMADIAQSRTSITIMYFNCKESDEITYTQCSRLYAANLAIPEFDILLTSDVDMLPISNYWNPDPNKITSYGRNLSDKHFPICYVGMSPARWREVMLLTGNVTNDMHIDIEGWEGDGNRWELDQDLLTESLLPYQNEIVYIDREKSIHSDYPVGRIDRSAWDATHKESVRIDCHLLRPGYSDENWPRILNEIKENLNPTEEDIQWLESYRNAYVKLISDVN